MSTESLHQIEKYIEENLGDIGIQVYKKSISKLKINENSTKDEIEHLLKEIEKKCTIFCGTDKAKAIFENVRKELEYEKTSKPKDMLDVEIDGFLKKHDLPTEVDIQDYAKYLTMKYGGNVNKIEKDIIEKVRVEIKAAITRNKITQEINSFLERFPQAAKTDVDDFINYIRVLKLPVKEDELRERVERERLYRKFHGTEDVTEMTGLDSLIGFITSSANKEEINKAMKKKGVSYLIKEESGNSDKSLNEFAELMKPNEKDMKETLQGMGLEHMIRKK